MSWLGTLKDLSDRLLSEIQELERGQGELEILIRQTHSELERLSPQEAGAQRRLREVEANLQAYGPAELRSAYSTARELELKLFVLRTQLDSLGRKKEELLARQRAFGEMHSLLARAILDAEAAERNLAGRLPEQASSEALAYFDQQMAYLSQVLMEGPAQSLVNASIAIEILRRVVGAGPERTGEELTRLQQTIEQALDQVKYAVYLAGPPGLSELGLYGSLKRLAHLLASFGGFKLEVSVDGPERQWPGEWSASVYRLVTGLLLMPLRHRASDGRLGLNCADEVFELSLGCRLEALDPADLALLQSLRFRAEALGGELSKQPQEGPVESFLLRLAAPRAV